ncbi:hypothetical protein DNTS_032004 [Danionella cerebrum]|uniref:C2H2-type domain-containing protein n=1 Tax=Danionella cerebrum TaxID=2873325 RepID=A0A553R9Q0_9TELE|nr:hypothetical protein DNTS_032004 [Danionella translucida]
MAHSNNHHKLRVFLETHSLCVRCERCCEKSGNISFSPLRTTHKCSENLLLIRQKDSNSVWRPVAPLPNIQTPKYVTRPSQYKVCWHYTEARGCQSHGNRCTFARSPEEAALWNIMKEEHLSIPQIVKILQLNQPRQPPVVQNRRGFGCLLCHKHFSTDENFKNHCFTVQHRRRIFEDDSERWQYREPPPSYKDVKLCDRFLMCEYGENCPKAHSQEELNEWRKRIRALRKTAREKAKEGLLSYQDDLLDEYRHSKDKNMIVSKRCRLNSGAQELYPGRGTFFGNIGLSQKLHMFIRISMNSYLMFKPMLLQMTDTIPEVSISCEPDLDGVYLRAKGIQCTWVFTVCSKEPLKVIALLKRELGAKFSLSLEPEEDLSYSYSDWFIKGSEPTVYEIPVSFKSDQPGLYEQWVMFDFNTRPVLRQKLKVRVGEDNSQGAPLVMPPALETPSEPPEAEHKLEPWNEENTKIIPFAQRDKAQRDLMSRYKLILNPQWNGLIEPENYKQDMHNFLYREEKVIGELLSRLNLRAVVELKQILSDERSGSMYAPLGTLFAAVPLSHPLTPDAPEGFIVKRHSIRCLVCAVENNAYLGHAYEAAFLRNAAIETHVHLELSEAFCSALDLQDGDQYEMEVQFQVDRLWFCKMHQAVDNLCSLDKVFPDLRNSISPVSSQNNPEGLNVKQQAAMNFVLGASDKSMPPLLIYGPFGTGKTQTLAKMAQALVKKPQNKILICTHTNSSADLYVKDHFHKYVTNGHPEAKPLRIKASERSLSSTDGLTLQYCHLSKDGQYFEFPDKAVLDCSSVIITTTSLALLFHNLGLSENYFSHILIDEASQMLECEALMALGLAGTNTCVVLAGDHMQMGPKLFSVKPEKSSEHTLLNRLFYFYQSKDSEGAKQSRIIFSENYRSTKDILDFVSMHFYVGKCDVIKARGNVPAHPEQHALQFLHVRGECYLDPTSMSWFNPEQTMTVVEILKIILKEWPREQWGDPDPGSICVLSQGRQVLQIRERLRQQKLPRFTVENAENVQGKQFRVIVISTVHTKDSLLETEGTCLEFFNDIRVLNTIITRAQSQIFVVGDGVALSCHQFGTCWRLWRAYIIQCISMGSAYDFTLDSLKEGLLEISESRTEDEDSSDSESTISEIPDTDDPILQELLDEDKTANVPLTEEGLFAVFANEHSITLTNNQTAEVHEDPQSTSSGVFKHCELFKECFDRGFARPLDDSTMRIDIKGVCNIGQGFPGDKVKVEILNGTPGPALGKVVEIIERADTIMEFVCTVERHDRQVMVPINKCITKIFTPFLKDKPNHIAVRKRETLRFEKFIKINEEAQQKYLFVVKILKWKSVFKYPLGIVVGILPTVASFDDGIQVLDIEYRLRRNLSSSLKEQVKELQSRSLFEEGRKDFRMLPTFTIDPAHSQDLDDAISVQDFGDFFEIGVHISDVASFVDKDSELDIFAKQMCTTFYPCEKEPVHMFPKELSVNFFSLIPDQDRRVISLILQVQAKTNRIMKSFICKSVIQSNRKFSYDEVEDILESNLQLSDVIEICLLKAANFAEIHRKYRKHGDWCYKIPDEDVPLGRRRSHQMVEELMVMFNQMVAERLLGEQATRNRTPLRCQEKPQREKLIDILEKNADLIPLSVRFSNQASDLSLDLRNQHLIYQSETFPILKSVLRCLKAAAEQGNIYKVIDFVATDEIHPLLLPFAIELSRLHHKACIVRSNSNHVSRVGHYDLCLDSYTWASSPIRRYLDIIVQRLLHSVIDKTDITYTPRDISMSCMEFSRKSDQSTTYERKANALRYASNLTTQSVRKVAYIVELNQLGTNFRVSFPLNKCSLSENLNIMSRDLLLADQPEMDEGNSCMFLKWVRRIYSFSNPHIHAEVKQQNPNVALTHVPARTWRFLTAAIREENWAVVGPLVEELEAVYQRPEGLSTVSILERSDPMQAEHYVELSMRIKPGQAIEVQLGPTTARGLLTPVVQLFVVHPKFEICMAHVRDPILSFSKYTFNSSRASYNLYMDYQAIWKSLCGMESAFNAVAEKESILIEDVPLKWERSSPKKLQGYFLLPFEKKSQWSIDCDLRNSFLCIRTRLKSPTNPFLDDNQCMDHMNLPSFTWVVHAIVAEVNEVDSNGSMKKEPTDYRIDFLVNHMSMTNIPEDIFCEKTRFTLELIPKLLPDVRKENAIDSLTKANELVKNIAMGRKISSERASSIPQQRFEISNYLPSGFSELNSSQSKAIREALTNPFTLIQGPPGTGKTVVGVHIVYWLHNHFLKLPASGARKKRAILYCGPSNKSVDVVAGHLLKLREDLRPLRVYSDQMEMLEFPYPGCSLKLSRQSKRGEKPNAELSSIALHHVIRKEGNPFSSQILAFDMKIQRGDHLTDEERKLHKKVLQEARKHELLRHDVILCTCTAASHTALSGTLDFKQIIIDECAMATEPEAFIPLVAHKPEQIVLLGDHKQLQPVVHSDLVGQLGMSTSLFERYMERSLMLDTQYRMQEDICAFPSDMFYGGKLKTGTRPKQGIFLTPESRRSCIMFGHVEGKVKSLVVSTEQGNENSKANLEEAEEVVRITARLTEAGIKTKDIAILTPYNAQVKKITDFLLERNIRGVTVNTIMRSQGSEWKFVIMSTVRSCPKSEIETQATKSWLLKQLGFVMDPHQVNVGITRAQEGLCIIGNEHLLRCSSLWRNLLDHYQEKNCVVNPARYIQVQHLQGNLGNRRNARR